MRVEIPQAAAHFVRTEKTKESAVERYKITTVSGVVELWATLEQLTGARVEFKTGNWVLESTEELAEEHKQGKWTLTVRYSNFSNYAQVAHTDQVLDFYGAANNDAHQLLANLTDELIAAGFRRFDSYIDSRDAVRRARSTRRRKASPVMVGSDTRILGRLRSAAGRNVPALIEASVYAGRLYRNMVAVAITLAALTDLDLLRPMIIGIIPPAFALGVMVFAWERAHSSREPWATRI